jgi:hypothetical protein
MSDSKPAGKKPLKAKGREKVDPKKVALFERNLEKNKEVHHDLFRLEVANTRKNLDWTGLVEKANWQTIPHVHFYHTVDSDGKTQKFSAPTAGHFHEQIIERNEDGDIVSIECGPPMVMHKGKPHPYANDKHTHDVTYLESEMVQRRVRDNEAALVTAMKNNHEKQVSDGLRGLVE